MPLAVAPDPRTPDEATIMQRVRAGLTYVDIGLGLGVSPHRVARIAKAHGYDARKRIRLNARILKQRRAAERQQVAFAKAREAAEEARLDALYGKCPVPARVLKIPEWVRRADLAADYHDHARVFDEFAAARHCRGLLAEMRRSDPRLSEGRGAPTPSHRPGPDLDAGGGL